MARGGRREGASFCGGGWCCQIITLSLPAHTKEAGRESHAMLHYLSSLSLSFLFLGVIGR